MSESDFTVYVGVRVFGDQLKLGLWVFSVQELSRVNP